MAFMVLVTILWGIGHFLVATALFRAGFDLSWGRAACVAIAVAIASGQFKLALKWSRGR